MTLAQKMPIMPPFRAKTGCLYATISLCSLLLFTSLFDASASEQVNPMIPVTSLFDPQPLTDFVHIYFYLAACKNY